MKHIGKVLPKEEVLANRSSAYNFIDFKNCKDCNKSLEDCTCINDTLDMKQATLQELIMKMTGRSYFESIRFIKSKEKETNIENLINKKLYKPKEFIQYDEVLIKRLNNQTLESPRAMRYFEGRQITKKSIEKFSLGYSEKQDMVTIPVQSPDGMTIGFVARTIENKEFKNTPGLPKSKILFNLHRVKQSNKVYVVESSFDAIRLEQIGVHAVATLGATISKEQRKLLKQYFH